MGQLSVIGDEEQSLGIPVEPSDRKKVPAQNGLNRLGRLYGLSL